MIHTKHISGSIAAVCFTAAVGGCASASASLQDQNIIDTIVIEQSNKPQKIWSSDELKKMSDKRAENVTIQYFLPEKQNGTAVLICPGGGYGCLCDSYEGTDIAKWLNKYGVTGIVLRYRVGANLDCAPLDDASRAMAVVRANAKKSGIDPHRIGVIGFSAGGHLASALATHGAEDLRTRPDFQILVYPVITFGAKTHVGSRNNFLGPNITPERIREYSGELQVSKMSPKAFVSHAVTDQLVPVDNSRNYVASLRAIGVAAEYLELPKGAHGLGCGNGPEWKAWQDACLVWMQNQGLVDQK